MRNQPLCTHHQLQPFSTHGQSCFSYSAIYNTSLSHITPVLLWSKSMTYHFIHKYFSTISKDKETCKTISMLKFTILVIQPINIQISLIVSHFLVFQVRQDQNKVPTAIGWWCLGFFSYVGFFLYLFFFFSSCNLFVKETGLLFCTVSHSLNFVDYILVVFCLLYFL